MSVASLCSLLQVRGDLERNRAAHTGRPWHGPWYVRLHRALLMWPIRQGMALCLDGQSSNGPHCPLAPTGLSRWKERNDPTRAAPGAARPANRATPIAGERAALRLPAEQHPPAGLECNLPLAMIAAGQGRGLCFALGCEHARSCFELVELL